MLCLILMRECGDDDYRFFLLDMPVEHRLEDAEAVQSLPGKYFCARNMLMSAQGGHKQINKDVKALRQEQACRQGWQ